MFQEISGHFNQWKKRVRKALLSDGGTHGICSWELVKMLEWDTRLGFKFMT